MECAAIWHEPLQQLRAMRSHLALAGEIGQADHPAAHDEGQVDGDAVAPVRGHLSVGVRGARVVEDVAHVHRATLLERFAPESKSEQR